MNQSKNSLAKLPALLTVAYFVALVAGTHWPRANFNFGFELSDKLMHVAAYAGLAALCRATWLTWPSLSKKNRTPMFFAVMLCTMGAIDELTQIPVPGRSGSIYDWVADGIGVASGLLFFRLVWPFVSRFFVGIGRQSNSSGLAAG